MTVNNGSIEALNQVQMQHNFHVERIRLEAAQALGTAEAVYNRLNADHERERQQWITAGANYQREIFTEASRQVDIIRNTASSQLVEMRDELIRDGNAQLEECRNVMESSTRSHAAELQGAQNELNAIRTQAMASHQEQLLLRGELDGVKIKAADAERRAAESEKEKDRFYGEGDSSGKA